MSQVIRVPDDVYNRLEEVRAQAYRRVDRLDSIPDRGEALSVVFDDYLITEGGDSGDGQ